MHRRQNREKKILLWKRRSAGMLILTLLVFLCLSAGPVYSANAGTVEAADPDTAAAAAGTAETHQPMKVRVGFMGMEGYHEWSEDGIKSGYGYDLLQLIRKYSNLNFEYLGYDKNWEESQEMLLDGEVDLITGARKTEERQKKFDFSEPIGMTSVQIRIHEDDYKHVPGSPSSYQGMKIGLLNGSSAVDSLKHYARDEHFVYKQVLFEDTVQLKAAFAAGEIDAIAATSLKLEPDEKILAEFDSKFIYVIVRKGDNALLKKINQAIDQIDANEGDWKNRLYYDNFVVTNTRNLSFTEEELAYIERHSTEEGKLIIATDTAWPPFSEWVGDRFEGIFPDYIDAAMKKCGMKYVLYDRRNDINDETVLEDPIVDLYFGYAKENADAENAGLVMSQPILNCQTAYLMRNDCTEIRTIGICCSTPYLNSRLELPEGVSTKLYLDTDAAKIALLNGEIDALHDYGYDAERSVNQDRSGILMMEILPDRDIQIKAVMRETDDHVLMSILMKSARQISVIEESGIISNHLSFSADDLTLGDYIARYPVAATLALMVVLVVLSALAFIGMREAEERRNTKQLQEKLKVISNLNNQLKENQKRMEGFSRDQDDRLKEITELNRQLKEAQKTADLANQTKSTFLFNMSHDIRTPMNAILGFAKLMENKADDPKMVKNYLQKIEESGEYLMTIINNVLDMARVEQNDILLDESIVDLQAQKQMMQNMLGADLEKKHQTFRQTINIRHPYILADQGKMQRILINLLNNAIKYTPEYGTISIETEELPARRDGYATYVTTVSDNGIGMSKEFTDHIFDSFTRERNSTESRVIGTGLGLAIVKKYVDLMGGVIEVESEPGKGSTFRVIMTHKIMESPEQYLEEQEAKSPDDSCFSGKRILLAEDNDLNAEIAMAILSEAGIDVVRAEDGVECIDLLDRAGDEEFDLILMDVQMPNMNGYEATRRIRTMPNEKKKQIPILAMTANAFDSDRQNAFEMGMNGHLAKPIDVEKLMEMLRAYLR